MSPGWMLPALVLHVEHAITDPAQRTARPEIGADVKIMGVRHRDRIRLTVACAFVGRFIRDLADYRRMREDLAEFVRSTCRSAGVPDVETVVNAADDLDSGSIYLTVSGLSAEAGDDGQAGRGNRVNGLITPFRPMTIESVAGKNPISHVAIS